MYQKAPNTAVTKKKKKKGLSGLVHQLFVWEWMIPKKQQRTVQEYRSTSLAHVTTPSPKFCSSGLSQPEGHLYM